MTAWGRLAAAFTRLCFRHAGTYRVSCKTCHMTVTGITTRARSYDLARSHAALTGHETVSAAEGRWLL